MQSNSNLGADLLLGSASKWTERIEEYTPTEFAEKHRYLPPSVSERPGPYRADVAPHLREIQDCADIRSPVRQVDVLKGVQAGLTTLTENIVLYFAEFVGNVPMMYMTADADLAKDRVQEYFIPMFNESGLRHVITAHDFTNTRKTGLTERVVQFRKGGTLKPFGGRAANKMRSASVCVMIKDELDGWPIIVGTGQEQGSPDALTDARTDAFPYTKFIIRLSTPLTAGQSAITDNYKRGDQRQYHVACRSCGHPQPFRWDQLAYELESGVLVPESVRFECKNCGHAHFEKDKRALLSDGAKWVPTATPEHPGRRSYHVVGMLSPWKTWSECVQEYLRCYDPVNKRVISIGGYQTFYNNVLAKAFTRYTGPVQAYQVSAQRRPEYLFGAVPNRFSLEATGLPISFLTVTGDLHTSNLAVAVHGWTAHGQSFLVLYERLEDKDCTSPESPVWQKAREIVQREYEADNGWRYKPAIGLFDAGFKPAAPTQFAYSFPGGVFPIVGRGRNNYSAPRSFTSYGETHPGFMILVDYYKDVIASALRNTWHEEQGTQLPHHVNLPADVSQKQEKELSAEVLQKKELPNGKTVEVWHRPSGRRNELFDLTGYGMAGVDILMWDLCVRQLGMDQVDSKLFWQDTIDRPEAYCRYEQ